jgi:hypothetical protein
MEVSKWQLLNPLSDGVNNSMGMLINTIEHFWCSMVSVINLQYYLKIPCGKFTGQVSNDLKLYSCRLTKLK